MLVVTETWLGAPRIPEDLPLALGKHRAQRKPAAPRAAQLPKPPIAGLVHAGPEPTLLALPHARGLASSPVCRGPAQGTLPRCRPQLHGSCSAEARGRGGCPQGPSAGC